MGAELESFSFMLGAFDGMAVFSAPDSSSIAALSLAVNGTGAFSSFETHELFTSDEMMAIAARAKGLSYTPPGG